MQNKAENIVQSSHESINDFSTIIHLFLELRNKGVALTSLDFAVIEKWQNDGVNPEFIATSMINIAQEYREKNKVFPSGLTTIDGLVQRLLRHGERY